MSQRSTVAVQVLILLGAVLAILYAVAYVIPIVPPSFIRVVDAVAIAAVLYVVIRIITRMMDVALQRSADKSTRNTIEFTITLIGYGIIGIAVASALGVDVSSIVLGSAFASVVLGLAAQTVLSNVFGGLMILISRPIKVGQRVTISTWQFGILAPSYPPKFFSYDFLINGFTGQVSSIRLLYTTMLDDDNTVIEIPNSLMAQALLRTYGDTIVTHVKYELPKDVDPDVAFSKIRAAISRCSCTASDPSIAVSETTSTTYVVAIKVVSKGNDQEACKGEILRSILKEFSASTAPSNPSGGPGG